MKCEIEIDVRIPEGYEPIAYRQPRVGEFYLDEYGCQECCSIYQPPCLILRKGKTYRLPVLPADYGKEARFRDSEDSNWSEGVLRGYDGGSSHQWVDGKGDRWFYCEIEND